MPSKLMGALSTHQLTLRTGLPSRIENQNLITLQSIGSDRLAPIGWNFQSAPSAGGGDRPICCGRPNCRLLDGRSAVADSKKSSSQKRSRRNSVQNAPIGIFTALMGTIFVTISVFLSRPNFWATFGPIGSIGSKSIGSIG